MYVCICKGVTDHQIRKAVREGASSMRELRLQLEICSGCGKCGPCAQTVLRESLKELQAPPRRPLLALTAY